MFCACLCRQVYRAFLCRHFRFSFRLLVFHAFLCRQVLRLFMSTGLKCCAFPCLHVMSTGLCNYGVMFFYVVIFNPDVYFMTCKKIFDINHAFHSHNRSCIISGRYTAIKQWKLYIAINKKMATCPYIIGILIRHLIPSNVKVDSKRKSRFLAKLCELSLDNKTHL